MVQLSFEVLTVNCLPFWLINITVANNFTKIQIWRLFPIFFNESFKWNIENIGRNMEYETWNMVEK